MFIRVVDDCANQCSGDEGRAITHLLGTHIVTLENCKNGRIFLGYSFYRYGSTPQLPASCVWLYACMMIVLVQYVDTPT